MEGLSGPRIVASILCGIIYSYYVVSRLPKGIFRLVAVVPVIFLHIVLPWQVFSVHMRGYMSFMVTWISSFKLLMLCFDVGPLATLWARSSPLRFVAVAVMPIEVRQPNSKNKELNGKSRAPTSRTWMKLVPEVCAYVGILYCYSFRDRIPHSLIIVLYGVHIYLSLDVVLVSLATIVDASLGAELEPQFNKPYLASSLEDFWGKRWNLIVTNILRPSVYDPVLNFCWKTHKKMSKIHNEKRKDRQKTEKPPYWARAVAMLFTFIVSGVLHEVLMYYITEAIGSWEMMCFFILQGLCTAIGVGLRRWRRFPYIALPKFISIPITLVFIYVTGFWLFFPPFIRSGIDRKAIAEYDFLIKYFFPASG